MMPCRVWARNGYGRHGNGSRGCSPQRHRQASHEPRQEREEETKAVETAKGPSLFDPYFDIVEVKVYGQARFYNPPPADAETEPKPGERPPRPLEPASEAEAKTNRSEPAKPSRPRTRPAKAEPAKAEPAKAEPAKTEAGQGSGDKSP